MTRRPTLNWVLSGMLALTGCGGTGTAKPVEQGDTPRRIAVMAPAAAEMLQTLNCLDRVVAIGDYVSEPRELTRLPGIGRYDAPNIERLLSLETDLLITARSDAAVDAHARLRALGIPVLALDTSTFEGVFTSLRRLGEAVGRNEQARSAVEHMREEIDATRRQAVGSPRRRVLVVVGRDPLFVAGPGSHLDEMIRIAGGENVAGDLNAPYGRISMEVVLERMPDVIVDTSDNRAGATRGRQAGDWGRWEFVPAVKNGEVHRIHPSRMSIPGMRLPQMLRRMARFVHPDRFGVPLESDYAAVSSEIR